MLAPASAVVNGLLYVIGGYEGTGQTPSNPVQIYNPAKNTWTTGASMPTARGSAAAVVDAGAIYVIGGNGSTLRLTTVEKYVPSTNTWTEEAPLLVGKSEPTAALLGTTIVSSDGYTTSGDTGDNESYTVSTNTWKSVAADPNPRNANCFGAVSGQVYIAGGINNANPQTTSDGERVVQRKPRTNGPRRRRCLRLYCGPPPQSETAPCTASAASPAIRDRSCRTYRFINPRRLAQRSEFAHRFSITRVWEAAAWSYSAAAFFHGAHSPHFFCLNLISLPPPESSRTGRFQMYLQVR